MRGILSDTITEMIDRKMLWIYAGITLVGLLVILASRSLEMQFSVEGVDPQAMSEALGSPRLWLYNKFMYYLVFLSVLITAGLVPAMLSKGRVDYYLSKPLSRKQWLLTKMFSIWIVYGTVMVIVMLIEWAAGAAAFGVFDSGIFYIILTSLLAFIIWLSVTTFVGVLSSSAPMSIMAVFLLWILQQVLSYYDMVNEFLDSALIGKGLEILYYIVPKTIEMSEGALNLAGGGSVNWMPLYSSAAFAVVLMYVTVYMFNRKEY